MRKITTMASALMLGAIAIIGANAAGSGPVTHADSLGEPNFVEPADGSVTDYAMTFSVAWDYVPADFENGVYSASSTPIEIVNDELKAIITLPNGDPVNVVPSVSDYDGYKLEVSLWDIYENNNYSFPVGEYSIYIPAGVVAAIEGGALNDVIESSFKVIEIVYPTLNYKNGDFIKSEDFTLEFVFDEEGTIEFNPNADTITVTDLDNEKVYELDANSSYLDITENGFSIDLTWATQGEWRVAVPEAFILIDGLYMNNAGTYEYNVWNGMAPGYLEEEIPQYNTINMAPVSVTWDYEEVTESENGFTGKLSAYGYDWEIPASAFHLIQFDPNADQGGIMPAAELQNGNVLVIDMYPTLPDFFEAFTELMEYEPWGMLTLEISSGIVKNSDGLLNPVQSFNFDVYPVWKDLAQFGYVDGMLQVYYPGASATMADFENPDNAISLLDAELNKINLTFTYDEIPAPGEFTNYWDDNLGEDGANTFIINVSNYEDGVYYLNIEDNAMILTDITDPFGPYYLNNPQQTEFELPLLDPNGPQIVAPEPGMSMISSMQVVWGTDSYAVLTLPEDVDVVYATLQLPDETADVVDVTGNLAWKNEAEGEGGGIFADAATDGTEDDDDYMNSLLFQFPESYSEAGIYTLTIPAGSVLVNGVENTQAIVKYQIVAKGETETLEPAILTGGDYMDPLTADNGVVITWDYQNVTLNEGVVTISGDAGTYTMKAELVREMPDGIGGEVMPADFDDENGEVGDGTTGGGAEEEVYNALLLTVEDEDFEGFEPGMWEITIPAGLVTGSEDAVNEEQSFAIFVLDQVTEAPEIYPAVENFNMVPVKVDALNTIDISWADYYMVSLANAKIYLKDEDGNQINLVDAEAIEVDEDSGSLYLYVSEFTKAGGIYEVLVAPNSLVLADDNDVYYLSNEIVVTYDVEASEEFEPIDGEIEGPVEGIITVTYDLTEGWIEKGPAQYEGEVAYLVDESGEEIELSFGVAGYNPVYVEGDNVLVIDLNAVEGLVEGEDYTLIIPEGYLTVTDDEYNDHLSAAIEYEINNFTTGIAGINAENGMYRVFNLNGVNVLNTNDASELKNLNGLYIINGKKVIIRK